ncbi:hypothetical protein GCM10022232_57580 [Streptomyces plumbiresistens]|uniref:Uncharacterized protein n=1 Tax=Streptomyces plumbiresistens TaxID=511811 RepID=A0ABP7SB06_9ACTN
MSRRPPGPGEPPERIGEEDKGCRHLLDGLDPERILLAQEAVGPGRAALDAARLMARNAAWRRTWPSSCAPTRVSRRECPVQPGPNAVSPCGC